MQRAFRVTAVPSPQTPLDPSLKTIFDGLSEGILAINARQHRFYSNPALNELVGTDACLPYGTAEAPPYIPADQQRTYLRLVDGLSSLLSVDSSGAASGALEIETAVRGRIRVRLKGTAFREHDHQGRFAVFLVSPEQPSEQRLTVIPSESNRTSAPADSSPVPKSTESLGRLTLREYEVLSLLLDGRRVSTIAKTLLLSEYTVRGHLKKVFRKLHVHSQSELVDLFRPVDQRALN